MDNSTRSSLVHDIAFSMAKGMVGDVGIEMLRRIGSSTDYCTATPERLRTLSGVTSAIFAADYRKELLDRAEKEAFFTSVNNISVLTHHSTGYPKRLTNCSDAPLLLYSLGRCDLNGRHFVSIVGTRHATPYGIDFTTRLVADLARMIPDVAIVSGLAFGIDVAAHKAALAAGVPTIAVMAHGLKTIYPAEHRSVASKIIESGGAIVTEYPSDYQINRGSFLARNRIVAGLSDCVVVVESDMRGGSMSTARTASNYGRDVFAVPGRANDQYSRGTNHLIATNTAALITCAKDITEQMNWGIAPTLDFGATETKQPLSPELQVLLNYIKSHPDNTINEMCVDLSLPYSILSDRIFQLEMADRIMLLPGGKFAPTNNI